MPPKKQKDVWSNDREFLLVTEVQRRPVLWDTTAEIYRRADLKLVAYEEIAQALNEDSGTTAFTGKNVADRWKSIKSTFAENNRRINESKNKCSGSGADDVYKPKWHLFSALLFLKKTTAQAESISNLNIEGESHQIETPNESQLVDDPGIYFDENLRAFFTIPPDNIGETPPSTEKNNYSDDSMFSSPPPTPVQFENNVAAVPRPISAPPTPNIATTPRSSTKNAPQQSSFTMFESRGKKRSSAAVTEALQIMKKVASEPIPEPANDNAAIFGSLVTCRLREIEVEKGTRQRRECEMAIMNVLAQYGNSD